MSFGNSYNGGRTRYSTKVFLNVYDLMAANEYLYPIGMGFHHSGVEISGTEYSFASGAGIFDSTPGEAPGARFRERIELGSFDGGRPEVLRALDELRDNFGPDDYHLVRRNCNHFANALCWKLLNKTIPGYVNRLADIGVCCSCLLPKQMLEHAPVGDELPQGGKAAPNSRFMVRPGHMPSLQNNETTALRPFSGSGSRLGDTGTSAPSASNSERSGLLSRWTATAATTTSNSSASSSPQDELTDRREKARKAALARLERNQQKLS